jgi:hypothetical protein
MGKQQTAQQRRTSLKHFNASTRPFERRTMQQSDMQDIHQHFTKYGRALPVL